MSVEHISYDADTPDEDLVRPPGAIWMTGVPGEGMTTGKLGYWTARIIVDGMAVGGEFDGHRPERWRCATARAAWSGGAGWRAARAGVCESAGDTGAGGAWLDRCLRRAPVRASGRSLRRVGRERSRTARAFCIATCDLCRAFAENWGVLPSELIRLYR